jgi:GntR family transcriptional regulator of gluconate operon
LTENYSVVRFVRRRATVDERRTILGDLFVPLLRVERAPLLAAQVARILRNAIVAEELVTGSRLVEEKTAAEFGVSRASLREALRQLNHEGLVKDAGKGYVVVGISEDDIAEIFSLRRTLEEMAAALAVTNASTDDDAHLLKIVSDMKRAAVDKEALRFAALDIEFHSTFYEVARHSRLTNAWLQLAPSVNILLEVSNTTNRDLAAAAKNHSLLASAFVARDTPRLQEELQRHLDRSSKLVARARKMRDQSK